MLHWMLLGAALAVPQAPSQHVEAGCLQMLDRDGKPAGFCPLEGTKVEADIAGFGARVTVRQTFINPSRTPIEAIYTFPLPADAAVDRMNMRIGDRLIQGEIKRREEARRIYDAAKRAGYSAALLDQERPNIFTQSVANLVPNAKVEIEISYVQLLKFEEDKFEFTYPMVVGPRFLGSAPDPSKIAPPITPKGTRTGANIELRVRIEAGAPVTSIESELHEIMKLGSGSSHGATVMLAKKDEIPNRDFILRYGVASNTVQSALLTYADRRNGGFFTLILMPPKAPAPDQISPRELIFVVDQSGSQNGFPIGKSRELCRKMIEAMRPGDTFNVMGFNTALNALWPAPRPNTLENRLQALQFVAGLRANGGTMLNMAINAAMQSPPDPKRLRLILFNTDGFVGDDFAILDSIQKHRGSTRIFTFGIGNGVNRFLIDAMSAEGRGDAEIVTLEADTDRAVAKFLRRTQSPVLTNIQARFEGAAVADVLPSAIPDVFSEKPVILKGRYTRPGKGTLVLTGLLGGEHPWRKEIALNFSEGPTYETIVADLPEGGEAGVSAFANGQESRPENLESAYGGRGSAIATLWAREMIDEVMRRNWLAMIRPGGEGNARTNREQAVQSAVLQLGLRFGLMTQFTSFVAVEKRVVNIGGKMRTVAVPVEMTDGVSYEGIFGDDSLRRGRPAPAGGGFGGGGFGGGFAGAAPVAPVRMSTPALGRPMERLAESKDAGSRLAYDSKSKTFQLYDAKGVQSKTFDQLNEEELGSLVRLLDPQTEKALLADLTPAQATRYHLAKKVDEKLLRSKEATLAVQVWVDDWKPEHAAALRTAGLEELLPQPALNAAFGSCPKAALGKLASLPFVRRIVPLEG
jgi:Ca-activated chloride channel homolog